MATIIRKVLVPRFGDESVVQVVEAAIATPSEGEVQIQVLHSVVSGSDVNMRRGTYPFQKKPPFTPGYSMVGRVLDSQRAKNRGCNQGQASLSPGASGLST